MAQRIRIVCLAVASLLALQSSPAFSQDRESLFASPYESDRSGSPPRRTQSGDALERAERQDQLLNFDAETSPDHGASIDERLMSLVKDNTVGVRYEEREAYLRVLRLAHDVPIHRLERFATDLRNERYEAVPSYQARPAQEFPQVVDLFTHPDFYRGRPVTIKGTLRKLTKFDVGRNSLDLDQAYEGWVYTPDSQGNPVVVVFTSKDDRLPVKGDLQEEVRLTGYFFKMYGYEAFDATRKAPLILAGEMEFIPHRTRSAYSPVQTEWYVATGLAFLLGCYLVWQTNLRELPAAPPLKVDPDFNHFPPRLHPAIEPDASHLIAEPEDS